MHDFLTHTMYRKSINCMINVDLQARRNVLGLR